MNEFLWKYRYHLIFGGIFIVYFFNLFIDVMEVDAAQYSVISMEMSWTKSFLHVYEHGKDYLDKPPLLFWTTAVSYMAFGISNFSYKLPSVLITLLGIYSTFRFARLYYSKQIALASALILASTQALFLITNDVRTDSMLLGLTMFSVWQMAAYLQTKKSIHFILLAVGIAGAMMSKGPLILVILAAAFGTEFLLKKQWKNIFNPRWILLLILVGILLFPMCYGLYTQFDLHPEKTVYGLEGPSGLKFFFWTQSFGRITGENYWSNDSGYFFFTHSILWDFQPWIFFFVPALFVKVRNLIRKLLQKVTLQGEFITLGGFILIFIALSLSHYKLPHYIFVIFPFAAILTANFIFGFSDQLREKLAKYHFGFMQLFWIASIVLMSVVFPIESVLLPIILSGLFILSWIAFRGLKNRPERILFPAILVAIGFNLVMSTHFYPNLLSYQSSSVAGTEIRKKKLDVNLYAYESHSIHFSAQRFVPTWDTRELLDAEKGSLVFTNEAGYLEIEERRGASVVKKYPSQRATLLTLSFLLEWSRESELEYEYLLRLE
ncbi:MAG: glycosyltransferase family 39 protein [Crocinitomicaceae bacterium]|nr:glycosyltransferase family 39 protein [Crocinitomicaceae bacterium]